MSVANHLPPERTPMPENWKEHFADVWYKGDGAEEELKTLTAFIESQLEKLIDEIPTHIKPYLLSSDLESHLKAQLKKQWLSQRSEQPQSNG